MDQATSPQIQPDSGRFYVYVHVKADDGEPFYAGKGSGRRAWVSQGRSAWWKRIVAKHGLVVKIQKHFQDEEEAFASEIETIAILRDLGYELCNLTDGGDGVSGCKPSEETRAKMSAAKSTSEARTAQAERARKRRGETHPCAKLSDDACRKIFLLRAQGLLQKQIAAQSDCSRAQVSHVLSGKCRRNIYAEFHPE